MIWINFCEGIISLRDPPRPEVPSAIQQCRTAGIRVMMVTGDHASTAVSIAKSIGLLTYPTKDEIANTRKCLPSEVPEEEVMQRSICDVIYDSYLLFILAC
jgi:magnesium-transporting ATPase (P-type)